MDDCQNVSWPTTGVTGQILIADTGSGMIVLVDRQDSVEEAGLCMGALLPEECSAPREDGSASCQIFGVTPDEGGMLVSFSGAVPEVATAGVLRYDLERQEIAWRIDGTRFPEGDALRQTCFTENNVDPLCRLRMPHTSQWSPDGDLIVADTLNNRVLVLRPPDSGTGVADVLAVLDESVEGWGEARWPNQVQVIPREHQVFLLVTYKGADPDIAGDSRAGRIMLWEITDPANPQRIWAYPEQGYLAAVHGARFQKHPDGDLMLYAHSFGASDAFDGETGSVGMAWASLDRPPSYIADVLTATDEPLGFVRSAELIDWGATLLVTDSGCERPEDVCSRPSRVMELVLDLPKPSGLSGAFSGDHDQQEFVVLPLAGHPYGETLLYPFEAELMTPILEEHFLDPTEPSPPQ